MSERLEAYLRERGIEFRILRFEKPTASVEAAEKRLGVDRRKIIKSVLFLDDRGSPVLAIVTGDRKVDVRKLAKACGASFVRIAPPVKVLEVTGYTAGALPPVGHKEPIRTFIDPEVMSREKVYGGGGSINALLEIDPKKILELTGARVAEIAT